MENKINGFTWIRYNHKMAKDYGDDKINLDLNNIGIPKKISFETLKGDMGLSKQIRAFGFREPLNWKQYYDYVEQKDVVLDIGANIGLFSILSGKAKKLICVEPVKLCTPLLIENLKNNNLSNAKIINKAVGRNVRIEVCEHVNLSKVSDKGELVESSTLQELCKEYEPTLLRMDVEGYEYEIMKEGIPNCVNKICLEFHTEVMGNEKANNLINIFSKEGFKIDYLIEDLPLRLYPYYKFLKYTGLINLVTYNLKNVDYKEARRLIFKGRNLKYLLLRRTKNNGMD